jgi:hypothetical protein
MAQEAAWELVESAWVVMESLAFALLRNRFHCSHLP